MSMHNYLQQRTEYLEMAGSDVYDFLHLTRDIITNTPWQFAVHFLHGAEEAVTDPSFMAPCLVVQVSRLVDVEPCVITMVFDEHPGDVTKGNLRDVFYRKVVAVKDEVSQVSRGTLDVYRYGQCVPVGNFSSERFEYLRRVISSVSREH